MEIIEISKIIADEGRTIQYLQEKGLLKKYDECPYCGGKSIGNVRRQKLKCYTCRKEWGIRKGSLLEGLRLPLEKVLMAIKLFELEISALQASKQLKVGYKTIMNLFDLVRKAIYYEIEGEIELFSGEIELDESYFGGKRKGNRGRGAFNKIPVFGILERNGKVKVEIVKDVTSETLLKLTIKKVRRGSLIYTDKYKSYNGLLSLGFKHMRIDHSKRFGNGKVYINGIEGFWSFAKERLLKYHGVSKEKFPLYLKELEFRYNMREHDIFDLLIKLLVKYGLVANNA
ncbi:MAG TPA: IS1595 family transposase [Spirochaetota bacterium]|nr:IS1595 family transposase [Spirochaetota bacterium]